MQQSDGKSLRVVQFTDTHFFGSPDGRLMGVDTAETFAQVKELAARLTGTPDFYLLTGDLSQDETEDSYHRFSRAIRDLPAPAYFLPGNHDKRALMRKAFQRSDAPIKMDRSLTLGNWHVLLLDSIVENEVGGHLDQAELEFLDRELSSKSDRHALVCLHHHPVIMGSGWMDAIGVDNAQEFWQVVSKHRQVRGILWGHVHQEFDGQRDGIHLMSTPSTCVQFKPRSQGFALDRVPPGYRWLELKPDGSIKSSVERVKELAAGLDYASAGY